MKRIFRKGMCLFLLLGILFSAPEVFALGFSDIPASDSLAQDIETLSSGGYINGYPDGTFQKERTITRAEFIHIANGIFGYGGETNIGNFFTDVKKDAWYYKDVMIAQQAGYILGYMDGSFRPNNSITKEEVAAIFDRILSLDLSITAEQLGGVSIKDQISPWAEKSVRRVIFAGMMNVENDNLFAAKSKINRGQVVYTSARALEKMKAGLIAAKSVPGLAAGESDYDASVRRTVASLDKIISGEIESQKNFSKGDSTAQKALVLEVRTCMESYLGNKAGFDIQTESAKIKNSYTKLSAVSQQEFQRVVLANVDFLDLSKLRSFFGF